MNQTELLRSLHTFASPLARRIRILLQRGEVLLTKYQGVVRLLQVRIPGGQALSDVEHLEPFGFTSHPPQGSEAIVLSFNGNGSHSVGLLVGDRRYRLVIEPGETALYNQQGDFLKLGMDGTATLKSATKAIIDTPDTEITGTLTVTGATQLQSTLDVSAATRLQSTLAVSSNATFAASASVATSLSAASAAVSGAISGNSVSGGTVKAGSIDLASHTHGYQDDGNPSTTTAPA